MSREYYLKEDLSSQGIGRCYGFPDGSVLLTVSPSSLFVFEGPATPGRECLLPARMDAACHAYGDGTVSFVSKRWDQASKKLVEEVWHVFDVQESTVRTALSRRPQPSTRDLLFLDTRWLVAGKDEGHLFHFVSLEGKRLSSVVSIERAEDAPVNGVLGSKASGLYDGELAALDDKTFLYVFRYRPLMIAFSDTGEVEWSAVIPGLPSKEELGRRRPSSWSEDNVWLVPLSYLLAAGRNIAVLHKLGGQRLSIWSRAGQLLEVREIEGDVLGLWWEDSHLTAARRVEGERLVVEELAAATGRSE